jgi:hypothetical protein
LYPRTPIIKGEGGQKRKCWGKGRDAGRVGRDGGRNGKGRKGTGEEGKGWQRKGREKRGGKEEGKERRRGRENRINLAPNICGKFTPLQGIIKFGSIISFPV